MESNRFKKRKDCATMMGEWYEVLVTLLVFLRLKNNPAVLKFRLATNVDGAGAFDDVVVNFATSPQVWHTCLVQLKHKAKASLGIEQLFAGEKKGFSLPKYLKSYNEVRDNMATATEDNVVLTGPLETTNFILYTNARLHKTLEHKKSTTVKDSSETVGKFKFEDLLKSGPETEVIFKFNENDDRVVYDRLEGKAVHEFLGRLYIFSGQCSVNDIDALIKHELLTLYPSHGSEIGRLYDLCKTLFHVWWRDSDVLLDENSNVLTQGLQQLTFETNSFKHMDSYTLGAVYFSKTALSELHDSFQNTSFLHVVAVENSFKITTTKLHRMFEAFPNLTIHTTVEYFLECGDTTKRWLDGANKILVLVADKALTKERAEALIRKINDGKVRSENKITILLSAGKDPAVFKTLESQITSYRRVEDRYCFDDFDERTKETMANASLTFQTHDVSIGTLFNGNVQQLHDFLSGHVGASFVSGESKTIGQSLPAGVPYFIPRMLRMRNVVRPNVLHSSESTDVFLVTGVSVHKLGRLVLGYKFLESEKEFSTEESHTIKFHKISPINSIIQCLSEKPLFLIIEHDDATKHFRQLCLRHANVHWLHVESQRGQLVWKRSFGNVVDMKTFLDKDEESFYPQSCLLDFNDKVDIIIGEAGMGKTTLMEDYARAVKRENPQDWVILVNLRQQSDNICKEIGVVEILSVVGLSDNPSLFEKKLFEIAFKDIGNVIVILDGLDEVCPQYEEEVFRLLHRTLETKVKKVVISSRYSLRNDLETRFAILSKEIVGFSENNREEFLNHFGIQSSIAPDRSKIFGENSLLSIPLLTMMFAEVFKSSDDFSRERFESINLFNLVELFVENKFKIYFEKRRTELRKTEMRNNFFREHYIAALKVFLKADDLRHIFSDKSATEGLENGGIVHSVTDLKPTFIHQTFAEYFVAFGLSEYLDEIPTRLQKHMFKNVEGFRHMLDNLLAKRSELHRALLTRDSWRVEELLSTKRCTVQSFDRGGRQPIHLASSLGFEMQDNAEAFVGPQAKHLVEVLLDNGANVDAKDLVFSWTPLQFALETNSLDAAEQLLLNKAATRFCKIPRKYLNSRTLCLVINHGFVNVLKFLLSEVKLDDSVLVAAFRYGNPDIVNALLSKDRRKYLTTILHVSAEHNHFLLFKKFHRNKKSRAKPVRFLKNLFRSGETPEDNIDDDTFLHAACRGNSVAILEYLVSRGADIEKPNRLTRTPLHAAADRGQLQAAAWLVSRGAAVDRQDKYGATPLLAAAQGGHEETMKLLVSNGADVESRDKYQVTALHKASSGGHTAAVEFLAARMADVECAAQDGTTPLHAAAAGGHDEVVRLLVSRGADANRRDHDGGTPLHSAALCGHVSTVDFLISRGADFKSPNDYGGTPLYVAARRGCADVVASLVARGADFERHNILGATPLHAASENGHLDVVALLIDKGADVNKKDTHGTSPVDAAITNYHMDVARLLESRGGLAVRRTAPAWR